MALRCKALGSPPPRISWLRDDHPLRPSDRHHFTPGNQLLVISPTWMEDAGRYTCLMSNPLGTERAHSQLTVNALRGPCFSTAGPSTVTIGIIVIAVVTSIVVTSLVWVCIIYQTRKKSEECSVTNTGELVLIVTVATAGPGLTSGPVVADETVVPPDVPSYLSSQGTLSERQDVCIRVEAGGGPQPNGHIVDAAGTAGSRSWLEEAKSANNTGWFCVCRSLRRRSFVLGLHGEPQQLLQRSGLPDPRVRVPAARGSLRPPAPSRAAQRGALLGSAV